ncbi:hypothetical protein CDCA_CDCA11G3310 [Cyanidium caldarium]|uniref:PpiC domain-containing protein n=1 Tax=Cyanidium caldarium TaxID=2771 RepID=A0AAV9IYX1_CYACA|nr:hypothetical protein CDCA_CDCA11G3310 [Cyanidium caldarium]
MGARASRVMRRRAAALPSRSPGRPTPTAAASDRRWPVDARATPPDSASAAVAVAARVRHILVDDETVADRLVQELVGTEDAARQELWARRVRQHSRCPSRDEQGQLGWIGRGESTELFERAVLSDAAVAVQRPTKVRSEHGWHVVLVEQRQHAATATSRTAADVVMAPSSAAAPSSSSADVDAHPAFQETLKRLSWSIHSRPVPGAHAPGTVIGPNAGRKRPLPSHRPGLEALYGTPDAAPPAAQQTRAGLVLSQAELLSVLIAHQTEPQRWSVSALAELCDIPPGPSRAVLQHALEHCRVLPQERYVTDLPSAGFQEAWQRAMKTSTAALTGKGA